MNFKCWCWLL